MYKSIPLTAFSAAVLLAGCTMAPNYERPATPVATAFPAAGTTSAAGAQSAADIGWRQFFTDPRLQKLIETALVNNRDYRAALLRVEQAQAQYRIQRAALLPTINANGAGSRARTPGDLNSSGHSILSDQYSANVGVTAYELDIFGRVQSLKNKALETYLSTEAVARSTQLSLVAQVATQYLTVIEFDELCAISKQTLDAVSSSYDLRNRSYEIGTLSELDLRTSEVQVLTAKSNLANYTRLRDQAVNTLVQLVGSSLPVDLPESKKLSAQDILSDLPAGLPSDLLQHRPDILAAEHTLKAANASIGAARAAFFPRIALTGSYGTASADLSNLFKGSQEAWSFAPTISLPLFAGGSNKANLDAAKVGKLIEVANYEKAIQTAFREVSDGLVALSSFNDQISSLEALVHAQQRRYDISDTRYKNGVDNYLAVLLAQQDLFTAQQNLIQSRFARLANLVSLYKALGGGWQESSNAAATPAPAVAKTSE